MIRNGKTIKSLQYTQWHHNLDAQKEEYAKYSGPNVQNC